MSNVRPHKASPVQLATFLTTARSVPELQHQAALVERIGNLLQSDSSCLGAAVAGSLASGRGDRLSDIDLVVFCTEGSSSALLAKLRKVSETARVLYRLAGEHDEASKYEKTILYDLCSYEFHVIEPQTAFQLMAPYIELVNREGMLESRFSPLKPPTHEEHTPYPNGDAGLTWELFNCIKWLARGENEQTRRYLSKLARALPQVAGEA